MLIGKALLRFPVFLKTVEKCDTVLRSRGVHIINILTSNQETTLDSILNSVLGINVMQVINNFFNYHCAHSRLIRSNFAHYPETHVFYEL